MAVGKSTQSIITFLNVVSTFTDDFPLGILYKIGGKEYSSVIDFILDVLQTCNVDTDEVLNYMIDKIFPKSKERVKKASKWVERVREATSEQQLLEALSDFDVNEAEWINKLEDVVKIILSETLSALLSCSVWPVIPNWVMDEYDGKADFGNISIPIEAFDWYKKLSISPATTTGSCFYQVDTEKIAIAISFDSLPLKYRKLFTEKIKAGQTSYNGDDMIKAGQYVYYSMPDVNSSGCPEYFSIVESGSTDSGRKYYHKTVRSSLAPGDMFKSDDLDAFLWYVINKGQTMPQYEKNKMVWDSRLTVKKWSKSENKRISNDEWDYWLSSKKDVTDDLVVSGETEYTRESVLYPIMQLYKDPYSVSSNALSVSISSQRYYISPSWKPSNDIIKTYKTKVGDWLDDKFGDGTRDLININNSILQHNRSMYSFNAEYVKSIKIFDTKNIFACFIRGLYASGLFGLASNLQLMTYFQDSVMQDKINKIIDNIISVDDVSIEDCYYSFTNDDYDDLLFKGDLQQYHVVSKSYDGVASNVLNENDILDYTNSIDTSATKSGTITNVSKAIYSVSTGQNDDTAADAGFVSDAAKRNLVMKAIGALIYPLCEAILSPKVILLACINLQVAGIVDFDYFKMSDKEYVKNFLSKKLLAIMSALIIAAKDLIVELLMDLFYRYVAPLLEMFISMVLLERVQIWLEFIDEVLGCIPIFNFSKNVTSIADVRYADIYNNEETESTPQSDRNC